MSSVAESFTPSQIEMGPFVHFHGHAGINRARTAFMDMLLSFSTGLVARCC